MAVPEASSPAPGVWSASRAVVDDVDALMTSTATVAAPETFQLTGGDNDFDGLEITQRAASRKMPARTVTISRSDAAASYTTDDIIITGTYGGDVVTDTLTPLDANGNDIIRGTQEFDDPATVVISVPAQADANGAFTMGVGDIVAPKDSVFRRIFGHAATAVALEFQDGDQDIIPDVSVPPGLLIAYRRVLAVGTAPGVTVFR